MGLGFCFHIAFYKDFAPLGLIHDVKNYILISYENSSVRSGIFVKSKGNSISFFIIQPLRGVIFV